MSRSYAEYGQGAVAPTKPIIVGAEPPPVEPGMLAEAGAAWRTENMIGSWLNYRGPNFAQRNRVDEGFDFVKWADDRGLLEEADSGLDIFNEDAAKLWELQVKREREDRQLLAAGGLSAIMWNIGAAVADPTVFLPGGAIYRGARVGSTIARSAASVGAMAAAGTAIQETGLHATQELRTARETAFAIGGSAILGGLLGGSVAGILSKADARIVSDTLNAVANSRAPDPQMEKEAALNEAMGGPPVSGIEPPRLVGPVAIDAEFLRKAVGDDLALGNKLLRESVQEALNDGDSVRVVFNGKPRNIVGISKGMLKDESGFSWRAENFASPEAGDLRLEFEAKSKPPATVQAPVQAAADEGDLTSAPMPVRAAPGGSDVPTQLSTEDLAVKGRATAVVGRMSKAMRLNPATRALYYKSARTREILLGMFENRIYLKMHSRAASMGPAVETLVKTWRGAATNFTKDMDKAHGAFKKGGGKMTRSQFREQVWEAAQGDGSHPIPEVAKVATAMRDLNQRLADEGVAVGLLKEGDRPLNLYRMWHRRAIDQDREGFKRAIRAKVRADVEAEVRVLTDKKNAKVREIQDELDDLDLLPAHNLTPKALQKREKLVAKMAKVEEDFEAKLFKGFDADTYINDIVDNIHAHATGRLPADEGRLGIEMAQNGPLRGRTFDIDDLKIAKFVERDPELIMRTAARKASADFELFRRFKSIDLKAKQLEIHADYIAMQDAVRAREDLSEARKAKEIAKLSNEEKVAIDDMKFMRDMLRQVYMANENLTPGARILSAIGLINFMRAMGGMVVGSLTDVARPMMVHGLMPFMKDGLVPLMTNLKGMKLAMRDARAAGVGGESYEAGRLAFIADLADPYSVRSPVERFLQNLSGNFAQLTGILQFTDFMKFLSSHMTQQRMIRAMREGKDAEYLAYLNIGADDAALIKRFLDVHGREEQGIFLARTEEWEPLPHNATPSLEIEGIKLTKPSLTAEQTLAKRTEEMERARRLYYAALNKDVDTIITTPGIADLPKAAHQPYLKPLFQFRSFTLASHQAVLMRGMQEGPTKFITGLVTMSSIGMFIYWMRLAEQNRLDELDNANPYFLLTESISRSGLLAVLFDINDVIEKGLGIGVYSALQSLAPERSQSGGAARYSGEGVEILLGPTGDFATKLLRVAHGLTPKMKDGEFQGPDPKESTINAIQRLLPYSSIPYIQAFLRYGVMPPAVETVEE